ncbi:hypothetical protein ACSBR2_025968 [Camellia fascicularis]
MENMQYADELVKEFLIFRGFTNKQIQYFQGIQQASDTSTSMWSKPTIRRKTKIVCTIGPSTNTREMIWKLAEARMNVARMNMSHGDHASQRKIDQLSEERSRQVPGSKSIESQQEEERR